MKCPTCGREKPKTNEQRNKFHAMCRELGMHVGETAGKIKEAVKQDFFGIDTYTLGGKVYQAVKPSEQAGREEYSELISFMMQWAAENCDYVFEDGE